MMPLKALGVSLACLICCFSGFAHAGAAVERLADYLQEMVGLSGEFVQQTYSVEGDPFTIYSGNFKLKRPGFFYWQVQAPGQQLLVSDGTQVWDYDVDLEQLVHNKIIGGDVYDSPMQIISGGIDAISAHYRVEFGTASDSFVLLPIASGGGFTELRLTFEHKVLAAMEMIDAFGQRTEIGFIRTELNPQLVDSMFQLQIPAGVDVISNVPGYSDLSLDQSDDE